MKGFEKSMTFSRSALIVSGAMARSASYNHMQLIRRLNELATAFQVSRVRTINEVNAASAKHVVWVGNETTSGQTSFVTPLLPETLAGTGAEHDAANDAARKVPVYCWMLRRWDKHN
jgi:hypothetical protein